jgi:hypothetical protein
MAEREGMVGGEGIGSGAISNVGVLDLTGMKSTKELAGIRSQRAVSGRRTMRINTMTAGMAERESMRRQLSVRARAAPTK